MIRTMSGAIIISLFTMKHERPIPLFYIQREQNLEISFDNYEVFFSINKIINAS